MLPSKGWRVGEVEKCLGGDISVVLPSLNSFTLALPLLLVRTELVCV